MRSLILSLVFGAASLGLLAVSPTQAQAQFWRRGARPLYNYNYYPGYASPYGYPSYRYWGSGYSNYYYPGYSSSYYSWPGYTNYYYSPGYYGNYYYSPGYYGSYYWGY